ncbi:MAG TPA: ATP-binding protein [Candidatus Binatia bacterium]|nr:ATP-binding protein [Candidatus Binatia bacterium]
MGKQRWQRQLLLATMGLIALLLVGGTLVASFQWIARPFPGFFLHENLTVGPYFLPNWSAERAGMRALDRVLAVNGRALKERSELYDWVRSAPPGSVFQYRVLRDSQSLEFAVPSMTLSLHDWFLSFGVYVVMGIAFLIIGVAPYYFHASSPAALPLCFMVMAVFAWFQTTFDFMTAGALPKELRIFALTFTPSAALHLALLLKTGQPLRRSHPVILVCLYGVSLALGALNSLTFFGRLETWIYVFRVGYIFTCVGALIFLGIIGSALRRPLPDLERSRLRVMFAGALLGFLLPTLSTVLTSSFRLAIPYNVALVPTIFFPLSVAYALLKYSLFDLGNALKVGLSRIALTAFLLAMYAVVVVLLGPWAGIYDNDPLVPLFFSVLVVLFFNPLLRWIEAAVNRYIYRQDYDPAEVQEEISLFLRSLASPAALATAFVQRVRERMGIETASLAYRPKESEEPLWVATEGVERPSADLAEAVRVLAMDQNKPYHHGLSRGEVTTNPLFREKRATLLALFDQWKTELLLPLVFERQVRGFVSFGPKQSRREYSAEDLRLLVILTDQLALSLENGRLYEESVQAQAKAEATNKQLIEMDRVKKEFVANICHEVRTPVSTIIGYAEVLLLNPHLQGETRDVLDRLVNNGQELAQLMDNLMNFSRMEGNVSSAQFEMVQLKEILFGLEMMTQRLIRERPIQFGITVESAIDTIESDPQKLQQILVQLLTNALKFTEKGRIDLTIQAINENGKDFLKIAVADTGIGIKREDQEVIFEDFRQLDGSSTRQYGGTGLGLGLAKKLAAALGGTIQVWSEVGIGSIFSLLIPVKGSSTATNKAGLIPLASATN